jgi:hypothetical protein
VRKNFFKKMPFIFNALIKYNMQFRSYVFCFCSARDLHHLSQVNHIARLVMNDILNQESKKLVTVFAYKWRPDDTHCPETDQIRLYSLSPLVGRVTCKHSFRTTQKQYYEKQYRKKPSTWDECKEEFSTK